MWKLTFEFGTCESSHVKSCEFSFVNTWLHMRSHDFALNHTCEFMWNFCKDSLCNGCRLEIYKLCESWNLFSKTCICFQLSRSLSAMSLFTTAIISIKCALRACVLNCWHFEDQLLRPNRNPMPLLFVGLKKCFKYGEYGKTSANKHITKSEGCKFISTPSWIVKTSWWI